jgi:hypothetical protein
VRGMSGAKVRPGVRLFFKRAAFAALAVSCATATGALAAKSSPPVSVHAIFDNNAKAPFRVGQIVQVNASPRKPKPGKITQVCFAPAPIARPACSKSPEGAPSAPGTTKITVSFSRRGPYTLTVKVLAAATKVGGDQGGLAVPATVICPSVSLYGNVHGEQTKAEKPVTILPEGTKVALYNMLAPGAIVMVDYATGTLGIGEERCAKLGI